jgi:hypothetical protein
MHRWSQHLTGVESGTGGCELCFVLPKHPVAAEDLAEHIINIRDSWLRREAARQLVPPPAYTPSEAMERAELLLAFGHLAPADVGRVAQTCHEWSLNASSDDVWSIVARREAPPAKKMKMQSKGVSWKTLFKQFMASQPRKQSRYYQFAVGRRVPRPAPIILPTPEPLPVA